MVSIIVFIQRSNRFQTLGIQKFVSVHYVNGIRVYERYDSF